MYRVIQRLGPLRELEPASHLADAAERTWIVDGTLIPVPDRTAMSSHSGCGFWLREGLLTCSAALFENRDV